MSFQEYLTVLWSRFAEAPGWVRYGLAVGMAVLAVLARGALSPFWGNEFAFIMVFPATAFVALLVGLGPGLVAVLVACALTEIFILQNFNISAISGGVVYVIVDSAVVFMVATHRDLWLRLERQTVELQERTRALTAEVTQRRQAEEALLQAQKLEAVGRLTGGIAHDFNNIMTVVAGNLDLIVRSPEDVGRVRRWAGSAQNAIGRAARLTTQLLIFSRKQAIHPEDVAPVRLLHEFEGLIQRAAGERTSVEIVAAPGIWPCRVDPAQFETALLNLVINARDALTELGAELDGRVRAEAGRVRIELQNARIDAVEAARLGDIAPGDYVSLAVEDTGCGMASEVLAHVFEPFFTTKGVGKGSGLGLAMVWGFVKQSGGHAVIVSGPGQGTVVTLYLPRAGAEPWDRAACPTAAVPAGAGTILVVEDEDDVRAVTSETLTVLGYEVEAATNAEEALAILRAGRPIDLLLSDVVMPQGLSGVELAHQARALRPGLKILLVSGYAENVLERLGACSDIFQILAKPYRQSVLADTVRAILAGG